MIESKDNPVFQECIQWLKDNKDSFSKLTDADIEAIPSDICKSVTVSTLHGCPPEEIESIASYLLTEKGLNTFVKCNPTLLGYEEARKIMDDMGYDYVAFGDFHFKDDLQFEDAVPMLTRLRHCRQQRTCLWCKNHQYLPGRCDQKRASKRRDVHVRKILMCFVLKRSA